MDTNKYSQFMTDLTMGAPPEWKNLNFLERGDDGDTTDPKTALRKEIDKLRMEKTQFAAELEKA